MFLKPALPIAPTAPPISSLTPSTVAMLVKEIQKLIPKTSPAINLSRASISAIVKELGVELPDLLKGLGDASSVSSVGSDGSDIADIGDIADDPDVSDIPEPPLSSKSVPSRTKSPKTPSSVSSTVRVSESDKDELNTVLGREAKRAELIGYTLSKKILIDRNKSGKPPTPEQIWAYALTKSSTTPKKPTEDLPMLEPVEEKELAPEVPVSIKPATRETKAKNKDLPYGDEAKRILDKATELGVVGLSGKIKGKYKNIVDESTKTEYEIVIPKKTDTYGDLYSTNKIPIIITNKYLSQAGNRSNKEDFLNILQPITSQGGVKYSSESVIQNLSSSSFINPRILIDTIEGRTHFISDRLLV
jgi:hypothetical protein